MKITRPKKVLIVDDSATMRTLIRQRIETDRRLEVVGEARDAHEARRLIKETSPDVLTLDVEMPHMDGITFLEKLMRLRPLPVVMISSETRSGSRAAVKALSLGAVDCIGKPATGGGLQHAFERLPELLVAAASARVQGPRAQKTSAPSAGFTWNGNIVLIGSSTGGVDALETVLSGFPENAPPTLIAQHMPASFLENFAGRLHKNVLPQVSLAEDMETISPGRIFLAPGGQTHLAVNAASEAQCRLLNSEKVNGHCPSVEVLFESALPLAEKIVAVMLTGMGRDGAKAMLKLRQAGARCIAQDRATSVVFGMPRAVLENGAAENAVPLNEVAGEILRLCGPCGESRDRDFRGDAK
ncbi:protein-glutamate methylesterase/protein-glutamine glutaminase [Thioclava atlantica]|uniref:Protein-glutamate methylesterase/protein-glutamine glutaminase n=1 Tax=Thioclava atlantica TaxID=1317124 RepID=A0A085TXF9_9RHOB|nr:chemotaxis response regulator protein-glutamate methylesterase [Thioclava atlantica]KFE35406.1 chemotaxis-specific protein-glutamate methyltransferase [Thioclava atlantica]